MANLKKLTGITGLNPAHPLYSAVDRLLNFDSAITDIKAGATYSSTGALIDDADLGYCREFDANGDATTPNLSVPFNSTVMMIYKPTGANTAGSTSVAYYLNLNAGGNALMFEAGNYSGYDYRIQFRGSSSAFFTIQYVPYKTNGAGGVTTDQALILSRKNQAHATAFDFKSGDAGPLYQNGSPIPRSFQSATPAFTPSANPVSVPMTNSTAAAAGYRMSAIVVFNRLLTDEEKASVTSDPWELVVGALPLEVSLSAALTPGATITATFTNYESLPTSVTVVDSRGNDLVSPLTATGATTATFTVPALASSTAGQEYVQYGAVNLTFGGKTISSTFNPVSPLSYVNLVAPVATTAFEAWGSDVPVANEQLTSESNFDVNGNFTGADPDATYTCWITRLDGTNHRFTVSQGSAGPGPETVATPVITPESGTYSNSVTVAITTATSGAAIRYTTNGSDVTSGSTLYSTPFSVTDDATVKARGFKDGMTDSAQASQTYVINSTAITGVDELSPWQPEYTHAIRINQIIDSAGLSVAKVSVHQQEYIYALKVNEIITALNLPIKRLSVQQPGYMTALTINAIISAVESTVYGLNFNKSSIYGTLANRVIDVTGDIEIEFYTPDYIGTAGFSQSIVAQCAASTFTAQEFELYFSGGSGNLVVNIGGTITSVLLAGQFTASTQYRIVLSGATSTVYNMAGGVIRTTALSRGAAREPSAAVTIGARFNGTSMVEYFGGVQRNLKINGVLWPMNLRDQLVQPSTPAGNNMTLTGATLSDWVTVS